MIRATLPVALVIVLAVTAGALLAQYKVPSADAPATGQLAAASPYASGGCCSKGKAGEAANLSLAALRTDSEPAGRASGGCPLVGATRKECFAVKAECSAATKDCSETRKECSNGQSACSAKTECSGKQAASCVAAAKCSSQEDCPVTGKECSGDKAVCCSEKDRCAEAALCCESGKECCVKSACCGEDSEVKLAADNE